MFKIKNNMTPFKNNSTCVTTTTLLNRQNFNKPKTISKTTNFSIP